MWTSIADEPPKHGYQVLIRFKTMEPDPVWAYQLVQWDSKYDTYAEDWIDPDDIGEC